MLLPKGSDMIFFFQKAKSGLIFRIPF
jgi:hypothetical protein